MRIRINLYKQGLEGVLDIEQYCEDNNIDAEKVTSLSCSDNQLSEIKGLDKLVNLYWLRCHNNQLTELDTSKLVNLYWLHCHNNQLTELDLSNLVNLEELYCYNNELTKLKGLDKLVNLDWLNGLEYKQPEPGPVILYKLDLLINKIEKLEQIILDNKR